MVQGEERVFNCCEIALSTEPDPDSHPLAFPEMSRLRRKTQARLERHTDLGLFVF
jgi:hypothetical protein